MFEKPATLHPEDAAEDAAGAGGLQSGEGTEDDAAPAGLSGGDLAARRDADLRIARLHLRLGAYALARAELEGANEDRPLTGRPLLDLAEVRWRTGDLAAAGRAAEACLASGGQALTATVIAAEAAMADGRPTEASNWLGRSLEVAGARRDEILAQVFAGMPRSSLWPADPAAGAPAPVSEADRGAAGRAGRAAGSSGSTAWTRPDARAAGLSSQPGAPGRASASGPDPIAALAAAGADLEAGDPLAAAIRLGVVLRLAPALAPAVLELLDGAPGALPALIRGDAYRLVGREAEAERAYAQAAEGAGVSAPGAAPAEGLRSSTSGALAAGVDDANSISPRQPNQEEPS